MFGIFKKILGSGKISGVLGAVLKFTPLIIDLVERIIGPGKGVEKKAKVVTEVVELIKEFSDHGDVFELERLNFDPKLMLKAIEDEDKFRELVGNLVDAQVQLSNYINSFAENDG